MATWRDELIGQQVLVLDYQIIGKVTKVFEAGEFLREDAEPDEKPVEEYVIQLESGHAFLAGEVNRFNFKAMNAQDIFVFESAQESFRASIQMAFRVAIAAGLCPEDGLVFVLAAMGEAERELTSPDEPEEVKDGT